MASSRAFGFAERESSVRSGGAKAAAFVTSSAVISNIVRARRLDACSTGRAGGVRNALVARPDARWWRETLLPQNELAAGRTLGSESSLNLQRAHRKSRARELLIVLLQPYKF